MKEINLPSGNYLLENEIFKDIPGYEGIYQVSNFGRIKSFKFNKEKILKNRLDPYGYYQVILRKDNKSKNYRVHSLVVLAFYNFEANKKFERQIDHIDRNPLNNNLENLRIVSATENQLNKNGYGVSKHKHISYCKQRKKWIVQIFINKKNKNLGYYDTEEEAVIARDSFFTITNSS